MAFVSCCLPVSSTLTFDMSFHGLQFELRTFGGAAALRVVHPRRQRIAEHQHEALCLDLHVLGSYTEFYHGGRAWISGPSVVLHPPGEPHANSIDDVGLEAIGFQMEVGWLRSAGFDNCLSGTRCWIGGRVASAARWLATMWSSSAYSERELAEATARFLTSALQVTADPKPFWLQDLTQGLEREMPPSTIDLARALNMHPAWVARAYRAAVGEGIHETLRRKRVERAVSMLRSSDDSLAQIALDAGFCDQSHMNRAFRAVIGRTPVHVRAEQELLRGFHTREAN